MRTIKVLSPSDSPTAMK